LHATKACRQVTILINATKNAIGYKMWGAEAHGI
jgi:hypothetical protein